ncbi:MAG: hypothetical protein MZW92_53715 [Comamonadaceae bacterium]|nr:hypothetical protein [Comamonadaceae bacterium]
MPNAQGRRSRGDGRAGPGLRGERRDRASPASTTSTRTCPRATRSRSTTARSPPAAPRRGVRRAGTRAVRLVRVHLEEDAGKSLHEGFARFGRVAPISTSIAAACRWWRS